MRVGDLRQAGWAATLLACCGRLGSLWVPLIAALGPSGCRLEASQAGDCEVAEEFAEVVAGCEQLPLAAGVVLAAQQDVFALQGGDLAEDWFDDGLAPGVVGLACFGAELAGHRLLERVVLRDLAAWCGRGNFVVTEPSRGDEELRCRPARCELRGGFQVRLRVVPGIGQCLLGARPVLRPAWAIIGVRAWLSAAQLFRSVAMIT